MSEPSIEEIVARIERVLRPTSVWNDDLDALIASWRERGKAIEQMRAYQAQLEERIAAMQDQQANALQQALYDALKDKP